MTEETKRDYRDTVFLPKTDFPMKAGLPQKEPGIAARWEEIGLYQKLREARAGRDKFILHDGPPYANGDMHIGHALNHILKDMVCRTQNLIGKDAPYVPGWDCHGLPIEWKVEEQYRKDKKAKPVLTGAGRDEAEVKAFRDECRAYAQHWVDVQRGQLKRLGIMGDWDHPYLTMQKESEAVIVAELLKLAEAGNLYRGSKPVMWSPVEQTALAEAEVEYEDITSTQVDVAFEIVESPIPELVGAYAVIWTTTPWTIPVNQAIAYGPEVDYIVLHLELVQLIPTSPRGSEPPKTDHSHDKTVLVAKSLADEFVKRLNPEQSLPHWFVRENRTVIKGSDLAGTVARHPMAGRFSPLPKGEGPGVGGPPSTDAEHPSPTPSLEGRGFYARPRPFLPGDFVTTESGTGLVHMAPDHGEDDFELCKSAGINPVFAVMDDGRYRDDWAWLGGQGSVINEKFNSIDGPILQDLLAANALLTHGRYDHSYPHSWRSKAKVIFRCTPQWFVPMDRPLAHLPALTRAEQRWENEGGDNTIDEEATAGSPSLRELALDAIRNTRFVPEKGRNRIGSMVEGRPDWVLSRQRAWGVPITLFARADGSYLQDLEVNARIVAAVREEGMDAWNSANKAAFLGPDHDPQEFEMVTDILDVWFDSGSTHAFVLESGRWPDLKWPADLYLEGSDQHRGWFQSSLLESCATRGRAPYDQVLTHGFTMDAAGKKMSKSLGNTVDPLKVMEQYGADIIRLWALSVDFTEDHRIGDEILKGVADQYRKLRNTFRYLLGALDGFDGSDVPEMAEFPELERYVLTLLGELDAKLRRAIDDYDFNTYVRALIDFCNEDLSAFYFDIRKDSLYCDGAGSVTRRACRATLDVLFHALIRYAAPVLVFTTEEVWGTRYPDSGSVHLLEWPSVIAVPDSESHLTKWTYLRGIRNAANVAIESLRRTKHIKTSLEANIWLRTPSEITIPYFEDVDLSEILMVASVEIGPECWDHGSSPVGVYTSEIEGQTDMWEVEVHADPTAYSKCGRCWRHLPEVAEDVALCSRCDQVVNG